MPRYTHDPYAWARSLLPNEQHVDNKLKTTTEKVVSYVVVDETCGADDDEEPLTHDPVMMQEQDSIDARVQQVLHDIKATSAHVLLHELGLTVVPYPTVKMYSHALGPLLSYHDSLLAQRQMPPPSQDDEQLVKLFFGQLSTRCSEQQLYATVVIIGGALPAHIQIQPPKPRRDDPSRLRDVTDAFVWVRKYDAPRVIKLLNKRVLLDEKCWLWAADEQQAMTLSRFCAMLTPQKHHSDTRFQKRPHAPLSVSYELHEQQQNNNNNMTPTSVADDIDVQIASAVVRTYVRDVVAVDAFSSAAAAAMSPTDNMMIPVHSYPWWSEAMMVECDDVGQQRKTLDSLRYVLYEKQLAAWRALM